MRIRYAQRKDIQTIATLMLDEFKKPPFNERVRIKVVLKSLEYYFRTGKAFIALDALEIVGAIVFKIEQYWEGPVAVIEDLVVKEEFKKQGVDGRLIWALESYAHKNGLKRILFTTHKKSPGIPFFQKSGYSVRRDLLDFEKTIC